MARADRVLTVERGVPSIASYHVSALCFPMISAFVCVQKARIAIRGIVIQEFLAVLNAAYSELLDAQCRATVYAVELVQQDTTRSEWMLY